MSIIWSEQIDPILSRGISLDHLGVRNWAADLAGFTEDDGGEAAAGRDGQGAVVARGWGGHQGFTGTAILFGNLCCLRGPLREQARSHSGPRSNVGAGLLANARSAGFLLLQVFSTLQRLIAQQQVLVGADLFFLEHAPDRKSVV